MQMLLHLKMGDETAAIFVFTSEAENFPIVLLDAMIAGAAIITSSGPPAHVGNFDLLSIRLNMRQ